MKNELKVKVLDALKEAQPTCFTKENVYKCSNDGMVCFNGFVAELINGNKYELDDYWDEAFDRAWESADEYLMDEVRDQLSQESLWDEISSEEQERLIDARFETARDNYEPDVDTSEVNDIVADAIAGDLEEIYQDFETRDYINRTHYAWINGQIDFDVAMAEFEYAIVRDGSNVSNNPNIE